MIIPEYTPNADMSRLSVLLALVALVAAVAASRGVARFYPERMTSDRHLSWTPYASSRALLASSRLLHDVLSLYALFIA